MIIYGWKTKLGKGTQLHGVSCPQCKQPSLQSLTLFRYFHIYWIPFFPYSRKLASHCTHCNAFEEKGTTTDGALQNAFLAVKPAGFPVWMFSGALVLALFFGWVAYEGQQREERSAAAISQPAVGDFYIVETKEPIIQDNKKFHFRILRASSVNDKQIDLDLSEWAFPSLESAVKAVNNKTAAIKDFDKDEHFSIDRSKFTEPDALGGKIRRAIRF